VHCPAWSVPILDVTVGEGFAEFDLRFVERPDGSIDSFREDSLLADLVDLIDHSVEDDLEGDELLSGQALLTG
jgi:hypothetical protein